FNGEVRAASVFGKNSSLNSSAKMEEGIKKQMMSEIVSRSDISDVAIWPEVLWGDDVSSALRGLAEVDQPDLIVVGASKSETWKSMMRGGSTAVRVLSWAKVPVL